MASPSPSVRWASKPAKSCLSNCRGEGFGVLNLTWRKNLRTAGRRPLSGSWNLLKGGMVINAVLNGGKFPLPFNWRVKFAPPNALLTLSEPWTWQNEWVNALALVNDVLKWVHLIYCVALSSQTNVTIPASEDKFVNNKQLYCIRNELCCVARAIE